MAQLVLDGVEDGEQRPLHIALVVQHPANGVLGSALRPFQRALQAEFAGVPLVEGDLFGGVASGLAYSGG